MMKFANPLYRSIRLQLIVSVALIHAVLMTLFVWDLVHKHRSMLYEQAQHHAQILTESLADSLALWAAARDVQAVQDLLNEQKQKVPQLQLALFMDTHGKVLAHTDMAQVGRYVVDPLSRRLLKEKKPAYQLLYGDEKVLDAAAPVMLKGHLLGWVRVRLDVAHLQSQVSGIILEGILYTLFAIGVGALMAWWLGRRLTQRLYELEAVANQVAEGRRDIQFKDTARYQDELSRLGRHFNDMLAQLRANEQALTQEYDRLRQLLRMLPVGIVLFDRQGRLRYANPAFERMLGVSRLETGERFEIIFNRVRMNGRELFGFGELLHLLGQRLDNVVFTLPDGTTLEASMEVIPYGDGSQQSVMLLIEPKAESGALLRSLLWDQMHDPVTGLPNQLALKKRLAELKVQESAATAHACLWGMDLDHFRQINEVFGFSGGDQVLADVVKVLTVFVGEGAELYHLGGDRFVALWPQCPPQPEQAAAELIAKLEKRAFMVRGQRFTLGLTVVVIELEDFDQPDAILLAVEQGIRQAKQDNRGAAMRFKTAQDIQSHKLEQLQWLSQLKQALQTRSLVLLAQPLVSLTDPQRRKVEMLVRLRGEDGTLIPPMRFLPVAEQFGLMHTLDMAVVDQALAWLQANQDRVDEVNINLSGHTLNSANHRQNVIRRLKDLPQGLRSQLCFEITETVAVGDLSDTEALIQQIRALGCRVAIDDFGSGYASFNYLKSLSVDEVKIDGAFVRDMMVSDVDAAMVGAIVDIAHRLNLQVVAEFVETGEMVARLRQLDVEYLQGYYFSAPVALDQLDEAFWQAIIERLSAA